MILAGDVKSASLVGDATNKQQLEGGVAIKPKADWNQNNENAVNYVKNRTHYIEKAFEDIVINNSTELGERVDLSVTQGLPSGSMIAYKISDAVLSLKELDEVEIIVPRYTNGIEKTNKASELLGFPIKDYIFGYYLNDEWVVIYDFTIISVHTSGDFSDSIGVVIPSTGMYIVIKNWYGFDGDVVIKSNRYQPLDERFIPESIARKEDIPQEVERALQEAKESGEFDGADGKDYILTEQDKQDIADLIGASIEDLNEVVF